ncbi:pirin family protein [Flammeovirga sp. SubArs3]|uniref:pirin family protein n=1 Tax=Flammeovirga sp. SubArs3 TaxID=2995316 RepID=UPI00248C8048|nr:pirin family protein [Flammeovirga sp. SubArs3]
MNRKKFLSTSLKSAALGIVSPAMVKAKNIKLKQSDYDQLMKQVGFNHIPNKEHKTMNTVLHKADTRGHANHGWLDSHHTFSFANYYNPERVHFGALRVLNDDKVAEGKGFGTHPHDNMEIISIPMSGDLEHKDSMGNIATIKEGEIQVMSAGTGIYHSEYNKNLNKNVEFLQIWVFPNQKGVTPRYDQISIEGISKPNQFNQILSPNEADQGVWIHQNAWFNMGTFDQDTTIEYSINDKANGVYAFVLEGDIEINGQKLNKRDGFGIWDTEKLTVKANKGAKVLLMEVPMEV